MTGNIRTVILAISLSSALLGFVGWRVYATRTQPVPQYGILGARSGSHPDGCSSLLGLAEQIVQEEPVTVNSQLTVFVTGDRATANEPIRLAKYPIPRTRKAIEGRAAGVQRQQDLLADLLQKCQSVRTSAISPIFLGIVEALADLRAQGCNQNSGCKLYIDSDGEENVNREIRQALSGAPRSRRTLPAPADNSGIHVTFCGLAVTTDGAVQPSQAPSMILQDHSREDRQRIWESLFTVPGLVSFAPYCPTRWVRPEEAVEKSTTAHRQSR